WPAGRCETAWPRSCAGSTPTRSTGPRWRPPTGSGAATSRYPPRPSPPPDRDEPMEEGMAAPDIAVHAKPDVVAAAAAARLITRLVDLQAAGTTPKVVLTGG